MNLQPCFRSSPSRFLCRSISAQSLFESVGNTPSPLPLPALSKKSSGCSFRKKIEASSRALVEDAKRPDFQPLLPPTLPIVNILSRHLEKIDRLVQTIEHRSLGKKRKIAFLKAHRTLTQAISTIGKREFCLSETSLTPEERRAMRMDRQMSELTVRINSMAKQLRLARENLKDKGMNAPERAQVDVISAEISFLRAKQAALRYSAKRIEKKRQRELESTIYTKIEEGALPDLENDVLEGIPAIEEGREIARLAHGLDRVLFNPNVYWFQDPNSKVYNFPQELQKVPTVSSFAFERVGGFIPSSRDSELANLAQRHGKRFTGSTSSLSGILSHIYFLISAHKAPDTSTLTPAMQKFPKSFPPGAMIPAAVKFTRSEIADNVYALDSVNDQDEEGKNILTFLGTMLERYLTLSPESFEKFDKAYETHTKEEPLKEAYRYSKSSKFVMRSQLDCQDARLPGSGVFDLKTRACIAIRRDRLNWEENAGYQITKQTGPLESFEREYFDLIRSAFLKYQFQVRIGDMDGVFVAYHNTEKLFGFQYIPLTEMDNRLFGSSECGKKIFDSCVGILETLVDKIVDSFPGESVSCLVESKLGDGGMNVWIYPANVDPLSRSSPELPIKQFRVRVQHTRDGRYATPAEAMSSVKGSWTLQYSIYESHQDREAIWKSHDETLERKQMAMWLPNGVTVEDFLKTWQNLNYGAPNNGLPEKLDEQPVDESVISAASRKFLPAHSAIQRLRRLAQKGRIASQLEEGLPKVVWGQSIEDSFETADGFGRIIFQDTVAEEKRGTDA